MVDLDIGGLEGRVDFGRSEQSPVGRLLETKGVIAPGTIGETGRERPSHVPLSCSLVLLTAAVLHVVPIVRIRVVAEPAEVRVEVIISTDRSRRGKRDMPDAVEIEKLRVENLVRRSVYAVGDLVRIARIKINLIGCRIQVENKVEGAIAHLKHGTHFIDPICIGAPVAIQLVSDRVGVAREVTQRDNQGHISSTRTGFGVLCWCSAGQAEQQR